MRIKNKPSTKTKRRILRDKATPQEVILWSRLRRNNLGVKFRRQHAVGPYIVDFYCPSKNLAIEIDGSQHAIEREVYDRLRDNFLKAKGLTVLRFWDNEINVELESVLEKIWEYVS